MWPEQVINIQRSPSLLLPRNTRVSKLWINHHKFNYKSILTSRISQEELTKLFVYPVAIPKGYVHMSTTLNNQPASLLLKPILTATQAYFMD